jgi:cytidine deaminase
MKYSSKKIKLSLEVELARSKAPITGFLISCAIITDNNIYFNHNFEQKNSDIFNHAEQNALKEILKQEKTPLISKIVMMAGGKIIKFKNYTPCSICSHVLAPYMKPRSIIELLPISGISKNLKLKFSEVLKSYSKLEYSKIENTEEEKLELELRNKTCLKEKDLKFISNLIMLGNKNKIRIYLTGSSSGRGGISNLIMKKTECGYHDIDLIVITKFGTKKIQKEIENLIATHYSSFIIKNRIVPRHKNKKGVVLKNIAYHIKNGTIIDLTFATNTDGAFRQSPYEKGNWYHQLV